MGPPNNAFVAGFLNKPRKKETTLIRIEPSTPPMAPTIGIEDPMIHTPGESQSVFPWQRGESGMVGPYE